MPNGGIHHCGHCQHLENNVCKLRNVEIEMAYWTTCQNWNSDETVPVGPILAIVCEVKNKAGSYAHIPFIYGNRAKTFQQGSGDTVIKFLDKKGLIVELPDVESYMKYYKEHCPDN